MGVLSTPWLPSVYQIDIAYLPLHIGVPGKAVSSVSK